MWRFTRRQHLADEMAEEMRIHVEMEAAELERSGVLPDEARRRALVSFGGLRRYEEEGREVRRAAWWEDLHRDCAYALRSLRRAPGYTATVVLTLAVGIAANTSVFSVANGILFKRLPYPDPARLLVVWDGLDWVGAPEALVTGPEIARLRSDTRAFEGFAALRPGSVAVGGGNDVDPQQVPQTAVSANFFTLLGIGPDIGRGFAPGDDQPGAPRTAVISRRLFTQRFGGDRSVVGMPVVIDGVPTTIIGVLPARFRFSAQEVDVYSALVDTLARMVGPHSFGVLGRIRSDVSAAAALADLRRLSATLDAEQYGRRGFKFVPVLLQERMVREVRPAVLALLGAIAMLVLIMCANLAVLALVRGARREHELTVRRAIGASGGRVARQLLAETLVLSMVGGLLGLMLGVWALRGLLAIAPAGLPRINDITVDLTVVAVTLGAAVFVGGVMGMAPAVHAMRSDLAAVLREKVTSRAGGRMRRGLVLAQVALSVGLLSGTGLLLTSFVRLTHVDPGFDGRNVLTIDVVASRAKYASGQPVGHAIASWLAALRALPGVVAAGASGAAPLSAGADQDAVFFPTSPTNTGERDHDGVLADAAPITEGYIRAMGMSLISGQDLGPSQRDSAGARVALIDDMLARRYFPNGSAVGQPVIVNGDTIRVLGVVRHVRMYDLEDEGRPQLWMPYAYVPFRGMTLAVRTREDPATFVDALRRAIHDADPDQAIASIGTMGEAVRASLAERRLVLMLVSSFALAALLLVALGVYGVTATTVTQRTREFGIRMALGAGRRQVAWTVLMEPLSVVGLGLVIGLAGTLAGGRIVQQLLYGVRPSDPGTLIGASVFLLVIATLAGWLPARRATRVDPMVALRSE